MIPSWLRLLPASRRERIESRAYLQNVLGNMGWLFADRIVRMGMGLLVCVWVARYLGPEKFGALNYAYAFVLLFSSVSSMGLESVAVRDLAGDPSRKNGILGTVYFLKKLAEELGNVSKACDSMGYHRDTFYEIRRAFQVGGVTALVENNRGPKNPHSNHLAPEIDQKILDYSLDRPTRGPQRVANELRLMGVTISSGSVRGAWLRHNEDFAIKELPSFIFHQTEEIEAELKGTEWQSYLIGPGVGEYLCLYNLACVMQDVSS